MSYMDPDQDDDPRKKRLEELLYIIGGCEVAIRNNQSGKYGAYPPLVAGLKKIQQTYLAILERVMNGLPENES